MSEVRLVVREASHDWSGTIHASCADRAIAALSADPVTLMELDAAVARFAKPDAQRRFFANLSLGMCSESHDAGLVVIDLIARLVVVDSTYSSAGPEGVVEYHDEKCCTETGLRYHLADDWLISSDRGQWRCVADERRRERIAKSILDARAVFYGRPMLEFIAREALAAFARHEEIANAAPQIHAAWLLTPRDDLGGACPRAIALERHGHLMRDLQDRCAQWSRLGECPRGLDASSHAYQYAGFGTHELVMYYHLVRELLWSCWERLPEMAQAESLTIGDFLTIEIPRLEEVREAWLDTPDPDYHGRTPRSIIDRERARLPESMSGHDAMVDPDCPCCQMLAEMPGPAFWQLDGSSMDDDFAFDIYHRTRETWDEERRQWEEHIRRFNAKWAERERLGVTDSVPREEGSTENWSRSVSVGDIAEVPLGIRMFDIGCCLAELIVGLRDEAGRGSTSPETQWHIDRLNRDFGNFRELLQNSDPSLAESLISPVLDRFIETLDSVATARPDLARQCESLTNDLHKLLDPPLPKGAR
ncbi:hypothetical protein SAMN05444166_1403 [Singulisphaera sp. GP187]|uniref:hypothetical protein n=1 Tax=Singulisphaera sp. GP187 TaxID=1882752 RepID=UPI00092AD238|nr:hypothetical protein [Singulisphaera sp. GP187]SIN87812.1 hypothetical protein SAMN05444166_1403 [Singulisphaera sp. GP187]